MDWIDSIQNSLNYIEDHLLEEMNLEALSKAAFSSSSHFQKIFRIVTGLSVSEYIRNRRLSLAGIELYEKKARVLETALKYGYDSPESFTKAFLRFHGVTPSSARKSSLKLKYFSPLTIQIDVKGGFIMSRKLISNVTKLYETPSENYMFPSCMRSVMAALGQDPAFDFLFFAGVTGDLFTQIWLEPKWQYNDSYSNVCHDTQEPIRTAFEACGFEYEYVPRDQILANKTGCLKKIVDSIDRGLPVLTFGIVGPPNCSIICGYDENGDVLIGWSQFTDETVEENENIAVDQITSENYFQKRNGLDESFGLIFFGKKKEAPPLADSVRRSILRIKEAAAAGQTERIRMGRQAFDAWADSLLCDDEFIDETMLERPLDTYLSCVVLTGTNMHYMQDYLDRALSLCPDLTRQIGTLKEKFMEMKAAFDQLIETQGGYFFEKDRKALLDKQFRVTLSGQVRKVGRLYEEAVQSI